MKVMCRITDALSSTPAIIGLPVLCFALRWQGIAVDPLVFALSVFALSYSQLIIRAGAQDTRAMQAKLDELIRALDRADNRLIGVERR